MSLQAKDLMIGDLLTFADCIEEGSIVSIRVAELHEYDNEFLASIDGDKNYDVMELTDEIVGIPLTQEILEKNGWVYDGVHLWQNEDVIALEIGCDGRNRYRWHMFDSPIAPINYVHELQHILTIMNIKETIEL